MSEPGTSRIGSRIDQPHFTNPNTSADTNLDSPAAVAWRETPLTPAETDQRFLLMRDAARSLDIMGDLVGLLQTDFGDYWVDRLHYLQQLYDLCGELTEENRGAFASTRHMHREVDHDVTRMREFIAERYPHVTLPPTKLKIDEAEMPTDKTDVIGVTRQERIDDANITPVTRSIEAPFGTEAPPDPSEDEIDTDLNPVVEESPVTDDVIDDEVETLPDDAFENLSETEPELAAPAEVRVEPDLRNPVTRFVALVDREAQLQAQLIATEPSNRASIRLQLESLHTHMDRYVVQMGDILARDAAGELALARYQQSQESASASVERRPRPDLRVLPNIPNAFEATIKRAAKDRLNLREANEQFSTARSVLSKLAEAYRPVMNVNQELRRRWVKLNVDRDRLEARRDRPDFIEDSQKFVQVVQELAADLAVNLEKAQANPKPPEVSPTVSSKEQFTAAFNVVQNLINNTPGRFSNADAWIQRLTRSTEQLHAQEAGHESDLYNFWHAQQRSLEANRPFLFTGNWQRQHAITQQERRRYVNAVKPKQAQAA